MIHGWIGRFIRAIRFSCRKGGGRWSDFLVRRVMRIYFADSQVPEMSSLSRDERYLIKSTTWKTVIQKTPWKRWIQIGVIGIGIVLGWLAGSLAVLMIDGQQKSGQINPT